MVEENSTHPKKGMKSKWLIACLAVAVLLVAALVSYKPLGIWALERATWSYLYSQDYTENDIESIRIDHSFIAGILGYGQWITEVIFKDEPYISYNCIIKGKFPLRVTGLYAGSIRGDISEKYDFQHDTTE